MKSVHEGLALREQDDAMFRELLECHGPASFRDLLDRWQPDDALLVKLLRRAIPGAFLESLGRTGPWCERPLVMGALCLNARTPRPLALKLLPSLYWREQAEVARSPWLTPSVRSRADALLAERLPELRLGDRITLARLATPPVLRLLLEDSDRKVVRAALQNPQLREADLVQTMRKSSASRLLIEEVAASFRWSESYAVRLALVLHSRTPLAIALAQLTSLHKGDLERVAEEPGLTPLIQISALRVVAQGNSGTRKR